MDTMQTQRSKSLASTTTIIATTMLLNDRRSFYSATELQALADENRSRLYHSQQPTQSTILNGATIHDQVQGLLKKDDIDWVLLFVPLPTIPVTQSTDAPVDTSVLYRPDSEKPLAISKEQFDDLSRLVPSSKDLTAYIAAYVDDKRSINFLAPLIRGRIETSESNENEDLEIMYGLSYFDPQPRPSAMKQLKQRSDSESVDINGLEDASDWPLRRTAIYYRSMKSTIHAKTQELWIVCSAKQHLEDAFVQYLRARGNKRTSLPFEAHSFLLGHSLSLWRPMLLSYAEWLLLSFDAAFAVEVASLDKEETKDAWNNCLRLTDVEDRLEDSAVAAKSLDITIRRLKDLAKLPPSIDADQDTGSSGKVASIDICPHLIAHPETPVSAHLAEQSLVCQALIRELHAYSAKAKRSAQVFSRLSELRHEDYNHLMTEVQNSTTELKKANIKWEKDKDARELQASINSGLGTFIAAFGVVLLPVAVFGTFFSTTKVLPQRLWWVYLVILVVWWSTVVAVWLVGASRKWWRRWFWMPLRVPDAQHHHNREVGDGAELVSRT